MYTARRFKFLPGLRWTSSALILSGLWASVVVAAHELLGQKWVALPSLPVSVMGTAVAFYLGFKGNAAYGRLWEARKIWGGIVNSSRTWAIYVRDFVTDHFAEDAKGEAALHEAHRELVYRHIAWLGALRTQLRRPKKWEHTGARHHRTRKFLGTSDQSPEALRSRIEHLVATDELDALMAKKNQATQLLATQSRRLKELRSTGHVDDFRHIALAGLLEEFYTLQGKCERIKNFPLPRQYATANSWFVTFFLIVLPMALLEPIRTADNGVDVGVWLAVPISMALSWIFHTWNRIQDFSENPFEGLINDIPMNALSRTIEIDLREIIGETELPPSVGEEEENVLL